MAKREDPFLLTHYRFLPVSLKARVDEFIDKLDSDCREFAMKRYIKGMKLSDIAEEMGYVERSLYLIRERVIDLWKMTLIGNDFEYHYNRALNIMQRYGAVDHSVLMVHINLYRYGLNRKDLKAIIDVLLASGNIKVFIKPAPGGSQPKRKYVIV